MRQFLLKAFLFLAIFKILDIGVFHLLAYLDRIGPTEDPGLRMMYAGKLRPDILIIGSSRLKMQINPEIIERETGMSAYNLAVLGSNFEDHFLVLKEFLNRGPKPRMVLFEADVETLAPTQRVVFRADALQPYMLVSNRVFNIFADTRLRRLAYRTLPSLAFRNRVFRVVAKLLHFEGPGDDITEVKGAFLREGRQPDWNTETTWKWTIGGISPERRRQFEELAQWADSQDCLVVLMAPARYKSDNQLTPGLREAAVEFYSDLALRHPRIAFLDYTKDERMDPRLDYFYDRIHMNAQGARFFSDLLAPRLARIAGERRNTRPPDPQTAKNPRSARVISWGGQHAAMSCL